MIAGKNGMTIIFTALQWIVENGFHKSFDAIFLIIAEPIL